jgi:hypothetical protein
LSAKWLEMEARLRKHGSRGLLIIDDCPYFMSQINILLGSLSGVSDSALKILMLGERSQWIPRKKSPKIFSKGLVEELSGLDETETERLVNLLDLKSEIRALVEPKFTHMTKSSQITTVKRKCSADMYVALKHIFASEGLDTIILREFSRLEPNLQDMYRTVAALEAAGTRVHRQLIIRLLSIQPDILKGLLAILEGLVDEYEIRPEDGLYGWRTRHEVAAQVLTRYKYADEDEFHNLLREVIDSLNPILWLERRTLNDLCNTELGIRRLSDPRARIGLYQMLIDKAPGERVPRHRLIYELLSMQALNEAELAIRDAEQSVQIDSPIYRYRVRLLVE